MTRAWFVSPAGASIWHSCCGPARTAPFAVGSRDERGGSCTRGDIRTHVACALRVPASACFALELAAALVVVVACARESVGATFELAPVALSDTRELDPEVIELTQRKYAAAERAPSSAAAHGSLALAYAANWLFDAAERSFDNAARLQPENALWRYHRALALREAGRVDDSFALLEQAARERPLDAAVQQRYAHWLLERGDAVGARAALTRALSRCEPDHADLLVALAGVDNAEERWQDAAERSRRALRRDASSQLAHHELGRALRGMGREAEAQRELEAGMGASPRFLVDELSGELLSCKVNYVSQLAEASRLMNAGKHAEALALVERVYKKRPDDVAVINNLAACLQETGDPLRAIELLRRAEGIDPRSAGVQLNLSDAHLRTGDHATALGAADRAIELSPELGRAHLARARALMELARLDEAYAALARALRLEPRNWIAQVAMIEICLRRKQFDEARGWLQRLGEVDPSNVPARANLALLHLRIGQRAEAERLVDELVRIAPGDARVQALQAELRRQR